MFTLWFWFFYKLWWFCLFSLFHGWKPGKIPHNDITIAWLTLWLPEGQDNVFMWKQMHCGLQIHTTLRLNGTSVSFIVHSVYYLRLLFAISVVKAPGNREVSNFFPKGIIATQRGQSELRYNWGDVPNNHQIFVNIGERYRELCTFAIVTALCLINFSDMARAQRPLLLQWLAVG